MGVTAGSEETTAIDLLQPPPPRAALRDLLRESGWIGLTSYGSGRQLYLLDAFVRRRGWVSDEEFTDGLAVGQIVPGANITNLIAYLGFLLHGWQGAAVGLFSILLPGWLVIVGIAVLLHAGSYPPLLDGALAGVGAVSVALVLAMMVRIAPGAYRRTHRGVWIAALVFLMAGPLRIGLIPTIVAGGALSVWLNRPRSRA